MEACDLEPFRYQATPQPVAETGAQANQINEQQLEHWLARFKEAVCNDLTALEARLVARFELLEARVTTLETQVADHEERITDLEP